MGTLKPLLLYSTHIIQKVEFALAITEEVDLLRTNLVVELVTLTFRLSKFELAYVHCARGVRSERTLLRCLSPTTTIQHAAGGAFLPPVGSGAIPPVRL